MHSLGSISAIASEKKIFLYFTRYGPVVNTMTCGGSHLGFPIDIKNRGLSNDHSRAVYAFFSETTNIIKAKLYMNVHWMVLYILYVFCSDMKFKMAATTGLA
jgi:hypothetical protein